MPAGPVLCAAGAPQPCAGHPGLPPAGAAGQAVPEALARVGALNPKTYVLGSLQVLYYALLGRPSPVLGILDFYLLVPLSKLFQKRWRVSELTLRDRMGGGNFGQARPALRGG